MTIGKSIARPPRAGRVAAVIAAVVVLAGLAGCVIAPYPGPGYYRHDDYYDHGRGDYYRGGYYYR